jgi:hypothetical protein
MLKKLAGNGVVLPITVIIGRTYIHKWPACLTLQAERGTSERRAYHGGFLRHQRHPALGYHVHNAHVRSSAGSTNPTGANLQSSTSYCLSTTSTTTPGNRASPSPPLFHQDGRPRQVSRHALLSRGAAFLRPNAWGGTRLGSRVAAGANAGDRTAHPLRPSDEPAAGRSASTAGVGSSNARRNAPMCEMMRTLRPGSLASIVWWSTLLSVAHCLPSKSRTTWSSR